MSILAKVVYWLREDARDLGDFRWTQGFVSGVLLLSVGPVYTKFLLSCRYPFLSPSFPPFSRNSVHDDRGWVVDNARGYVGDNRNRGGEEEEKENENGTKPAARRHVTSGIGLWRGGGAAESYSIFNQPVRC